MKRLLNAAAALVCAFGFGALANAQQTTITASTISMGGTAISTGTVTFVPVDVRGTAISFATGGGGLNGPTGFSCAITAGAITGSCQIPDAALTTPANILYSIQVADTSTGNKNSGKTFTLQQVANITGTTWALDHYGPPASTTNIQPMQIAYGTAAPPSSCNSPSLYVRNYAGGQLYTCVASSFVLVTGSVATVYGTTSGTAAQGNDARIVSALKAAGAYASGTTYAKNDVVTVSGSYYASLIDGNLGNPPATSPTQWGPISGSGSFPSTLPTGLVAATNGSPVPRAATTNDVNAALGSSNGLYIFGDSIGQAAGATSTGPGNAALQQGYAYRWQQAIGGPFLRGGTSGDQEADVNYKWVYRVTNPQGNGVDPLYAVEIGTNDATTYLGNTDKQAIFRRLRLGTSAWLGTPQSNKIFAQNCILSGGMAADPNTILAGLGAQATTLGAAASCVINNPKAGGTVYACYKIQDANTGTFTLSLDGTPQTDPFNGTTTWNAFGDNGALINTANSTNAGIACARFTGVSAGNHTVLFTVTSPTGGTAAVWPQWVGAAPIYSNLNPYVEQISPNQQNTGGAGAPYTATYAGFINTIVGNLTADGLNEIYSDTSNALLNSPSCGNGNQATMFSTCYADTIHPNNIGHAVMAATAIASTPSSFLLAVTHWNPKQPGQNYIPAAPLSPYQWFDVNPYNLTCSTTWCPGIRLQGANGQFFGITTNGNTGMTFMAPSGATGFSFCPFGGSGYIASAPPTLASCFMSIVTNGVVNFFQGDSSAGGIRIQSGLFKAGTAVTVLVNGILQLGPTTAGTCSSTLAGQIQYTQGNSSTKDLVQVCAHDASNVYAWRSIY